MPQVGDIWESYRANEFVLMIDGTPESRRQQGERASARARSTRSSSPTAAANHVYKIAAAKVKFEPLTIERYVDGSPEDKRFRDWFRQMFNLNSKEQGGSAVRKNGMIEKLHNGEKVHDLLVQERLDQVVEVHRPGSGIDRRLLKQTIVLEHEGLEGDDRLANRARRQARSSRSRCPIGYTDGEGPMHRQVVAAQDDRAARRRSSPTAKYQRNGGKLVTELLRSCIVRLGGARAERPRSRSRGDVLGRPQLPAAEAAQHHLRLRARRRRYTCPGCGESNAHASRTSTSLPVRMLPEGEERRRARGRARGRLRRPRGPGAHRADACGCPTGGGRRGGRAADAGERVARQERAARPLPRRASAMCRRTGSKRSGRES